MANHRVYYKGEGGGFPQIRVVVSLVCPCCPWLVLGTRVFQLCTNHLMWVMYRYVWVSEACQLFLVPFQNSNMPLYPSKCCELGSVPRLLPLLLFSTWTHNWVLEGVGSASYGDLLGLMYPFVRISLSWTLSSFNSSWFIRYGALAGGTTLGTISMAWSTCLFRELGNWGIGEAYLLLVTWWDGGFHPQSAPRWVP